MAVMNTVIHSITTCPCTRPRCGIIILCIISMLGASTLLPEYLNGYLQAGSPTHVTLTSSRKHETGDTDHVHGVFVEEVSSQPSGATVPRPTDPIQRRPSIGEDPPIHKLVNSHSQQSFWNGTIKLDRVRGTNKKAAGPGLYQRPSDPHISIENQRTVGNVPDHVPILLVTYYRGGSTFLGEAFNRNHKAFYWFEPLHAHRQYMRVNGVWNSAFINQNGTVRHLNTAHISMEVEVLANIFSCNLNALDHVYLAHQFITKTDFSAKLGLYKRCLLQNNILDTPTPRYSNATELCLPLAIRACKVAPIRVIKTIRIGLYMIPAIRARIPNVRIVYSTRDPRGIIYSRRRLFPRNIALDLSIPQWQSLSRDLCAGMHDDFIHLHSLEAAGNSVIRTRYEDLATSPKTTLSAIYDKLSLDLPEGVSNWFGMSTNATEDNHIYGTLRANSTRTAYKWREALLPKVIQILSSQCYNVLEEFGYAL